MEQPGGLAVAAGAPTPAHTPDWIVSRVWRNRRLALMSPEDKALIKAICDGGPEGLEALMGKRPKSQVQRLPSPNYIQSGIDRGAQRLGGLPQVRVDPPSNRESDRAKKAADKLERIIVGLDERCSDDMTLDMMLPQAQRWLIGYGMVPFLLYEYVDPEGFPYPAIELGDPFDCYPSEWGRGQSPRELAFIRRVSLEDLRAMYPEGVKTLLPRGANGKLIDNPLDWEGMWSSDQLSWANQHGTGIEIAEFHDHTGTYIVAMERKVLLDWVPNVLTGSSFVVAKRYSFNKVKGAFDHVIGLQAYLTRMNVLVGTALEDGVHSETNITGEVEGGAQYRRGRGVINRLTPGTQVTRPMTQIPYQVGQHTNEAERQFRTTAGYAVQQDGISPNSFVTGRGLEELGSGGDNDTRELQKVLAHCIQRLDSKRLEWDQKLYGPWTKPIAGYRDGATFKENYTPESDINGNHRTRRLYGAMAAYPQSVRVIQGLQEMSARAKSRETFMEDTGSVDNVQRELARIRAEQAEEVAMGGLLAAASDAASPDHSKAMLTVIGFLPDSPLKRELEKYWTPSGDQPSPEEAMAMMGGMPGMPGGDPAMAPQGPQLLPEILARMTTSGGASGGAQVVARPGG